MSLAASNSESWVHGDPTPSGRGRRVGNYRQGAGGETDVSICPRDLVAVDTSPPRHALRRHAITHGIAVPANLPAEVPCCRDLAMRLSFDVRPAREWTERKQGHQGGAQGNTTGVLIRRDQDADLGVHGEKTATCKLEREVSRGASCAGTCNGAFQPPELWDCACQSRELPSVWQPKETSAPAFTPNTAQH